LQNKKICGTIRRNLIFKRKYMAENRDVVSSNNTEEITLLEKKI
jgi:hypothetical protein